MLLKIQCHEFGVELFGVVSGELGVPADGHVSGLHQSPRLSHAIPFDDMFDNGNDFLRRQAAVGKNRTATLGKPRFAGEAVEQANVVVFAKPSTHADIFFPTNPISVSSERKSAEDSGEDESVLQRRRTSGTERCDAP